MVILPLVLALLYDVHGNLQALEAVLADARSAEADRFLLGGDYALFGAFPAETVSALRAVPNATWIRGNVDRWTADPDSVPDEGIGEAVAACREALGDVVAGQLGGLPEQVVIDGVRYCHASPISDMQSFLPDPEDGDEKLLGGVPEARVVFGHTHIAFARPGPGGIELFNPGSVGMPLDGDPRASYALVDDDGRPHHRRAEYDREPSIRALSGFGDVEWAARTVRRLRTAAP